MSPLLTFLIVLKSKTSSKFVSLHQFSSQPTQLEQNTSRTSCMGVVDVRYSQKSASYERFVYRLSLTLPVFWPLSTDVPELWGTCIISLLGARNRSVFLFRISGCVISSANNFTSETPHPLFSKRINFPFYPQVTVLYMWLLGARVVLPN